MRFELITPEGVKLTEDIDRLTLTTPQGQITILPHHAPMVTLVSPGEAVFFAKGKETPIMIHGGFCEVRNADTVVVLADAAEHLHEMDEQLIQEAVTRAENIKKDKFNTADYEEAAMALERELARRHVLRKYRAKGFRSDKPED